jgi:hypothetical protein
MGAHFLKESNGQNLLKSGTLQNGKNLPGLEPGTIEAAHGAFTEITHCRNHSGEGRNMGDLAARSLRVEPMQGKAKIVD